MNSYYHSNGISELVNSHELVQEKGLLRGPCGWCENALRLCSDGFLFFGAPLLLSYFVSFL
jgi:hypothetical protein